MERFDVVKRCKTCQEYFEELWKRYFCDKASEALHNIQKSGVHIIAFDFDDGEYIDNLNQSILEKHTRCNVPKNNKLHKAFEEAFFDDIYHEERDYKELPFELNGVKIDRGSLKLRDVHNSGIHIEDGIRRTTDQPIEAKTKVHIYGPCFVTGMYVEDQYTIASYLQRMLNEAELDAKVINKGVFGDTSILQKITGDTFIEGDVIIFDRHQIPLTDIPYMNMTEVLASRDMSTEYFVDGVRHCNHKVNQLIAETLFSQVRGCLQRTSEMRQRVHLPINLMQEEYIQKYFCNYKADEQGSTGAIVMNCNPFTLGHRYLIQKACEYVDRLIIFVVEENQSYFSFSDRFAMVCNGVADLKKVVVVPSGKLILSSITFPEYFAKEVDEDIVENVEMDVTNFADQIASILNIKYRFVGEEPEDIVTDQYNRAMKKLLPRFGIEVIEIPRKKYDNRVISASRVRKCLESNDLDQLRTLVPQSTMQYIEKGNYNGKNKL